MMSARDIRRRIRSIGSTSQITKAMQMVAASKMRRAQEAATAGRPFVRLLYRMQRTASLMGGDFVHPLTEVRPIRKRAVILVGTDRGLCGALNTNLFRIASSFDPKTTVYVAAGRKAAQFVARSGRQLVAEFTFNDVPRYPEARAIAASARDLFLKGEVDEVRIVANRYVNTLTQEAVNIEFLPIGKITGVKLGVKETDEDVVAAGMEFLFEPPAEQLQNYLLNIYVNVAIYQTLLNAKASEQSARMVSMKNATDSAESLIKELTLEYNKLRQGNITRELLDIAGGKADGD